MTVSHEVVDESAGFGLYFSALGCLRRLKGLLALGGHPGGEQHVGVMGTGTDELHRHVGAELYLCGHGIHDSNRGACNRTSHCSARARPSILLPQMTPITDFAILLGLVAVATALGLAWRATTGRVRTVTSDRTVIRVSELSADAVAGRGATLLQFSTEVCAPCTTTHVLLDGLARELDDVHHVDVDVTSRPEIASRFNLLQSPTTFILDGGGVVRARIGGAPRPTEVRAELDRILSAT